MSDSTMTNSCYQCQMCALQFRPGVFSLHFGNPRCPSCGSRHTCEVFYSGHVGKEPSISDVKQNASSRQEGGKHYKEMGVEPWDVIDTWPIEQQIGYHRGNALKYIMRMGSKDEQVQEVRKAGHYIAKLIEVLEKRDADK